MHMPRYVRYGVGAAGFCGVLAISSLWKISFWVGSHIAFFSATNCVAPLAGAFGGILGAALVFGLRLCMRFFWSGVTIASLLQGVPYFCASLYWATNSVVIRVAIPLSCMVLFWLHPVGFQAGIYAGYWFVPVVIALTASRSIFLSALASTFVAHAVGSVIWLYTVSMTPEVWIALMPVVAVERILFAAGMVVVHQVVIAVTQKLPGTVASFLNRVKTVPAR